MKKSTGIIMLSVQMALAAMMVTGIGLALPRFSEEYGFTLWQQGVLVSAQFAGFTVAVLIGGLLADKFGKIKMLTISLLCMAVAVALFGSISFYAVALVAVILVGASTGVAENAIMALALVVNPEKKDSNSMMVQVFFSIGGIAIPLLFLFAVKVLGSWRWCYYTIGVVILILFLMMLGKESDMQKGKMVSWKDAFSQYLIIFKNPKYLIAPLALFLYLGAEIGIWAFAPVFFEEQGFGMLSGIFSSVMIWFLILIGRLIVAYMVKKKVSIVPIMIVSACIAVVSLVVLIFASSQWSVIIAAIAGFACSPFYPLIILWTTRISGQESSAMIATTMAFGSFGPVVLSSLTGVVADAFGAHFIMAVPAACYALVLILLIAFGRMRGASEEAVTQ